ncbi:uncharacterized protein LOC133796185 [Humulus lupulus]|uniref:uncharacterized protein LOC133796185 n=1 Tax=Humulus lupulus TaxID=3486 RepID=UPI002B4025D8|nr:uncharacterized protein LOC133796185 [Humulus lupulus]
MHLPAEPNDLVDIKQRDNEPLKDYIQHFMREATKVKSLSDDEGGKNVAKNGKRSNGVGTSGKHNDNKEPKTTEKPMPQEYVPKFSTYSILLETRADIFNATQVVVPYRRPPPMRKDVNRWDMTKFCRFHNDYGHQIIECNHLKEEIEFLIRKNNAHLKRNIRPTADQHHQQPHQQKSQQYQNNQPLLPPPVAGRLDMICGRPHLVGNSGKSLERYPRFLRHKQDEDVLAVQERTPKQPRYECEPITFSEEHTSHVHHLDNDPLVVEVQIANMIVARTMIDHGSSANILFESTMERMNLSIKDLEPCE